MTPCPTCPGPDYCERCPTCELCADCKCKPPVVRVTTDLWTCEGCGRPIAQGERVHLYDDGVVAHVECPERPQA